MADILVVDDEENLSYSIQLALQRAGHQCRVAETLEAGWSECDRHAPDLAVIDVRLPDGSGLDLLTRFQDRGLDMPVIVITSFGTVSTAVQAMKYGALDFIQKPLSMEELCLAVDRCLENRQIRNQLDAYQQVQRRASSDVELIGECEPMQHVRQTAEKIAQVPSDPATGLVATLLLGETGTGKEVLARYIHQQSQRPDRPFIQVNCTAIPENLFEAELFGHEKGTFTDARFTKKGLLEMAHEGTLFLDEIGDMPPATQSKLLVAIERGYFRRLGGTSQRQVDARIMAATNADLDRRVKDGHFRADLYYRLKMFCVELPPLRERGDDLLLLSDHFLERFCRKFHRSPIRLAENARMRMRAYTWPGNVRELSNVLQRAALLHAGDVLEAAMLGLDDVSHDIEARRTGMRFDFHRDDCTWSDVEKQLLAAALRHTAGNISEAARVLGMTRGGLRHRMDKLGIHL